MADLILPAPAKLNRFLYITGRREDGYHTLQTVFQLIDWHDELKFSVRHDKYINVHIDSKSLSGSDNLMVKAAKLLQQNYSVNLGIDMYLRKSLPIGSGLGGGSSDAATTLLALNYLWQLDLSLSQLMDIGLQLGADVPFFIRGENAWGEGIGERLTPLLLPNAWFVILVPPIHIATADIFSKLNLTYTNSIQKLDLIALESGHNDCEAVVCQHYPLIDQALDWLRQHNKAYLTGTGACLFTTCQQAVNATKLAQRAKIELNMPAIVAKGLQKSPVHSILHNPVMNHWDVAKR